MKARSVFSLAAVLAAVLATVLMVPAAAGPALAAEAVPTKITSDVMRVEQGGAKVVFSGNVVVTRPDMTIRSTNLTVVLPPEAADAAAKGGTGGQQGRIQRIVAEGDVRIEREGRTGHCAKATWNEDQGLLVMEGDPVLREGDNAIAGKVIKIWVREGRSEVVGGAGKRVEATFFTPEGVER